MIKEFKDLNNLYNSIEDLGRVIKSMNLKPEFNDRERVLSVPSDEIDVLNEAIKVVSNYKKLASGDHYE
tara:strand:- start:404 stop:610 length:207 start_codon:yes stop_codon:yes gene_type:complete